MPGCPHGASQDRRIAARRASSTRRPPSLVTVALGAAALAADGAGDPEVRGTTRCSGRCASPAAATCEQGIAPTCPVCDRSPPRCGRGRGSSCSGRQGQDGYVREQRSDGTIAVTRRLRARRRVACKGGEGVHVGLSLGHGGLSLRRRADRRRAWRRGERGLHLGRCTTPAPADALVGEPARLRGGGAREAHRRAASAAHAALSSYEAVGGVLSTGCCRRRLLGSSGALGLSSQDVSGTRTDAAHRGARRSTSNGPSTGSLSLTHDGAGATGSRADRERLCGDLRRRGRPVDLMVHDHRQLSRLSVDLPNRLQAGRRPALGGPTGHRPACTSRRSTST